jgi:transposase
MVRGGFLDPESCRDLIELTRDGSVEHRLARRANALLLLDDSMSREVIAKVLFLDDDTVRTWYRLYQDEGIEGLAGFGFGGSACRLGDAQQDKLKSWIAETLPRTGREVGAWVESECGVTYESRCGLIALLHRLGMEHRKPKAVSSKLDPDKQAAFIKQYESLLNQLGDDEAVLFADAVHPTHAVQPVGCWGPKDTPLAVPQTSGRQLNIHGAIDLESGKTRMIEAATVNAVSTITLLMAIERMQAADPPVCGQRPLPPCQVGAGLAGATGVPHQASLHPRLLPASGSDRAALGPDAQARHAQPMPCDFCRFQSGGAKLSARGGAQEVAHIL